jgi:predicted restriction endonuclease
MRLGIIADMSNDSAGFGDGASFFAPAPTLETYQLIYHRVLAAYEFRCALTRLRFDRTAGVHSELQLVAIWPLADGGPLHVGNFLPMIVEGERAFRNGAVIIADDYSIVTDRTVLDASLAASIGERLTLPVDAFYYPDRAMLAHHRKSVFGS